MAKNKHKIESVLKSLNKKTELIVRGITVYVLSTHNTIGIKTWGKLDYLKSIGHRIIMVDNLKKVK
jgi:hypothetical protein